jgi:hypothetical protein
MLVQFIDPNGCLLYERPQTSPPQRKDYVTIRKDADIVRRYQVAALDWLLTIPEGRREYYSLTDAADVVVRVLLMPAYGGEEPEP